MRCQPPLDRSIDLDLLREDFAFTPDLDELAAGLAIWSHPTRLRIFALLDCAQQMCVCDLASVLGISVSAVSQNLAKMRAQHLVKFRRDAQTLYYTLTDHPLNGHIRAAIAQVRDGLDGAR